MTSRTDPQQEIDGDVYVWPRHLASTTGTGDPALAPLLDLGWDLRYDDDSNGFVSAPDRRVRLGYLPEGEDDGLWRINAYKDSFGPPAWGVCFNDRVPTEFVTAFTTVLATAYEQRPDAYLARPAPGDDDHDPFLAVVPLLKQGWQIDRPRWDVFAVQAPGGACRHGIHHRRPRPGNRADHTGGTLASVGGQVHRPARLVRHGQHRHPGRPAHRRHRVHRRPGSPAPVARGNLQLHQGDGPAHPDSPARPAGPHSARRAAGRLLPPSGRTTPGQRPALEHHQPTSPARPAPVARA